MPVAISQDTPDLYSVSLIPSLIPRQHESESSLIPRLSSPASEVGMRPDRFSSRVHRIQAHALQKHVGCFNHSGHIGIGAGPAGSVLAGPLFR